MIGKIKERLFSKQFLNLLMIKMLIPAMATGGMTVEVGAQNPLHMLINSGNPAEVSVMEMTEIDSDAIDHSEIVSSGNQLNMADDSTALISLENVPLATGTNPVNFIERNGSCGYTESEVKIPDLTFT